MPERRLSFLYDGLNPVQELQNGSPTANMLTGLGIDEYFQRTDSNGVSDLLTDALGSTLALTDSGGNLNTAYTYDPFGNTTVSGTPGTNPFQFTGRENDFTGLYYFRARYYDPTFQRFVSQDPIGFAGGDANLYGYVLNDPLNLLDLFGWQVMPRVIPPPLPPDWQASLPNYPPGEPGYYCDRGERSPSVLPPGPDPYEAGNMVACGAGLLLCPEDGPGAGACFILTAMACISAL